MQDSVKQEKRSCMQAFYIFNYIIIEIDVKIKCCIHMHTHELCMQ